MVARALLLFLLLYPLALIVLNLEKIGPGLPGLLSFWLAQTSFGIVGYVVAVRRPTNLLGWLMIGIGLVLPVQAVSGQLVRLSADPMPPIAAALVILGNLLGTPTLFALVLLTVLLFPSGRIPARPWRILLWPFSIVYVVFSALSVTFDPGSGATRNPLYVEGLRDEIPWILPAGLVIGGLAILTAPAWRWWRAIGTERSQLKWIALAALVGIALLISPGQPLLRFNLALALFPAAAGIAILRDQLFDIDFVINRSVLYSLVAITLVAALEVVASAAEQLLGPTQRDQLGFLRPLLVLVVLPGFRPLERALRPFVDRMLPMTERLVLLFADIVSSTEIARAMGDARWGDLLRRYYATVRRELQRFGGVEVRTTGDGYFATFRDALSAARCALSLATATSDLGMPTRGGLHIGDCDMRGGKPEGINVHLAARVMAAADGGTVLASESYRDVLVGSDAVFETLGPRRLKGIPGEVHLYRLASA
jgi:class 3 adenylate cyclase